MLWLLPAGVLPVCCFLQQIAGGYYGQKPAAAVEETAVIAATTPGADNKKKGWPVRLLTAYIVRPGEHCGFVKAWKKMEAKVADSKGLVALSLSKPAGV